MSKNNIEILGCISPYPTKQDNCPGYLLNISDTKILLDCGFGVCKKLNFPRDYKNLSIFISHFHKDHYSDIFAIAYASYIHNKLGVLKERIKLYIPKTKVDDIEYNDYLLVKKLKEHYFEIIEYDDNDKFTIDNIEISFMKNYHSINTYSTKLEFDNIKIIYTSDLGYKSKDELVNFSMNANILLIESSFVKKDNQNSEFHLHAYEAATIAKKANVKKLVLTHFWPGHSKKLYLKESKKIFKNTLLARTNKKVNI